MKKVLEPVCEKCAVRNKRKCTGRYQKIDVDGLPSIEPLSLNDDQINCHTKLVKVVQGEVFINYDCEYSIGSLDRLTKKKFTEFLVHLSEKDWFTMFIMRIVIIRIFELKKWKNKRLTFDISPIIT